jgi:shikimate kinase
LSRSIYFHRFFNSFNRFLAIDAAQKDHCRDNDNQPDNQLQHLCHSPQPIVHASRLWRVICRQRLAVYSPLFMNSEAPLYNEKLQRPIVLVGLMGVGKTTVGRRLANRLDLPFVDADEEIVRAANLSIVEIFERFGEAHFRDGERRVIARLIDQVPKVIATGGGAFIEAETRALILENATVIWLTADIDTLVERVTRKNDRPLLRTQNPAETLRNLAKVRNPIYAQAHIHVQSQGGPHDATVDAILKALQ